MCGVIDSMRLKDAIQIYLRERAATYAVNTVRNDKSALSKLEGVLGDVEVADIDRQSMIRVLSYVRTTRNASSTNSIHGTYSAFFRWCRAERLMPPDQDPLLNVRYLAVQDKQRQRVPLHDFPTLLEVAPDPQHRMLTALGLFLFLRASEAVSLRISDVDLSEGTINVTIWKTGDSDLMVIPPELDVELRRWFRYYQDECGPLDDNWYLVPAKVQAGWGKHRLNPTRPISRPQEVVGRVLEAHGVRVPGESMHCLRRSGARALFNELVDGGIDGALEIVQTMLHHKSVVMTERYLGITHSRAKRDALIREQGLFPSLSASNIVALEVNRGTGTDDRV